MVFDWMRNRNILLLLLRISLVKFKINKLIRKWENRNVTLQSTHSEFVFMYKQTLKSCIMRKLKYMKEQHSGIKIGHVCTHLYHGIQCSCVFFISIIAIETSRQNLEHSKVIKWKLSHGTESMFWLHWNRCAEKVPEWYPQSTKTTFQIVLNRWIAQGECDMSHGMYQR